jgi:hypothetical protein
MELLSSVPWSLLASVWHWDGFQKSSHPGALTSSVCMQSIMPSAIRRPTLVYMVFPVDRIFLCFLIMKRTLKLNVPCHVAGFDASDAPGYTRDVSRQSFLETACCILADICCDV